MVCQEIELLQHAADNPQSAQQHQQACPPPPDIMQHLLSAANSLQQQRQNMQAQVFRPTVALPTVSVEQQVHSPLCLVTTSFAWIMFVGISVINGCGVHIDQPPASCCIHAQHYMIGSIDVWYGVTAIAQQQDVRLWHNQNAAHLRLESVCIESLAF